MATQSTEQRGTLGTFAGVFTPSILTILGIILFLRLGFVVGNAGLINTLVIIGVATAVSVITSLSLAAIATNLEVRAGGDYYMISRTLGVDFGGAIGVVLFLAQSVSIAFYAVGFGEAVTDAASIDAAWAPQAIAAVAVVFLFGLAWLGADAASRFQTGVMVLLVLALASFYIGAIPGAESGLLADGLSPTDSRIGFWAVFAIFFPAVTGFTQGVSMSGDLKDSGRSLPLGTFAAVGVSTVVYVTVAVLFAANLDLATLADDTGAMGTVAAWSPFIVAGVVAATLSSAMASFLGAPRILQSMASDRIFPILNSFAKGHGPSANPRRAVLLSLLIALVTVALGELNVIAPVVSMFFLISYALLNYATYFEARGADPSFRPRFRYFNKWASLAGAIGCVGVMLAINPIAGGVAILAMLAIRAYLQRTDRPDRFTDASRSFYFQRVRESIRAIRGGSSGSRNWRPQVLAFSAEPRRRARLLRFASWMEGGSGLTAVVQIVVGHGAVKRRERQEQNDALQQEIVDLDLDVYGRAILAHDAMEALPVIVQSFGMGPIRANTVLFGWPESDAPGHVESYLEAVREIHRLGLNVVNMHSHAEKWDAMHAIPRGERRIDIWWSDDDASRMALLAAYLFTRTAEWSDAKVRLLASVPAGELVAATRRTLEEMAFEARIPAEVQCLVEPDADDLAAESADATFVFIPAHLRRTAIVGMRDIELAGLLGRLPSSAAFLAGEEFDLMSSPESAEQQALLAAEERFDSAGQRVSRLEEQLSRLKAALEEAKARSSSPLYEVTKDDVAAAELRVTNVTRRLASAQANLDAARRELARLTGS
ncbi:MAG: amino acid permease [Acidimicrobiia bacterium]|nr:amino acid permease [Acidimicrobiia bacterium]